MFDDTFVEELVVRRPTVWTVLARVGLVLVGVLFTMFGFLIIPYVFPLCLAIVCVLIYFLFRAQYVEYEYAFTNGDLDIDRIAGKRFRKRLVSIPESQIRVMAPYQAEYEPEVRGYQVSRKLDVSPSPRAAGFLFSRFGCILNARRANISPARGRRIFHRNASPFDRPGEGANGWAERENGRSACFTIIFYPMWAWRCCSARCWASFCLIFLFRDIAPMWWPMKPARAR